MNIYGTSDADVLTGTDAEDAIYGFEGDDSLDGGFGNDLLDGGLGNDVLNGGSKAHGYGGTDTVSYASAASAVVVNLKSGTATGGAGNDTLLNIEGLIGSQYDDSLYGGYGNDILDGGLGNDVLDGGSDDYVINSKGKSEYHSGGLDTADYTNAAGAVVVNLQLGTATGGAGTDTLLNIDNLIGSQFDDVLTGDANANTLSGGDGNDSLYGGGGDDVYFVDQVGDVVIENADEGDHERINASINYTLPATVEYLGLMGDAINGVGNDLNNSIIGNNGNNMLEGGLGSDNLQGGEGNDSLYGGEGADSLYGGDGVGSLYGGAGDDVYFVDQGGDVVVENADEGWDVIYASVSYILPATVEVLRLTTTPDYIIAGTGIGGGNVIGGASLSGNDLNNTLFGNRGNDMLDGGLGSDTLQGGAGNDTYVVNSVTDTVMEFAGGGTDLIKSAVSYNLANSDGIDYDSVYDNVENLTLTGKAAINGTGNGLNNVLTGNKAANILNAAEGNDKLIGGLGKDNLAGGLGADKFKFNEVAETGATATTRDIITDFSHGQRDKIDLSAIDANKVSAGNNAFSAPTVGGAFSGVFANPGELYFDKTAHILYGNNDMDSAADFSIKLAGMNSLAASDFVL
ncbi:MAG: calcium-binding protein [Methylococcaceae bacterium]